MTPKKSTCWKYGPCTLMDKPKSGGTYTFESSTHQYTPHGMGKTPTTSGVEQSWRTFARSTDVSHTVTILNTYASSENATRERRAVPRLRIEELRCFDILNRNIRL